MWKYYNGLGFSQPPVKYNLIKKLEHPVRVLKLFQIFYLQLNYYGMIIMRIPNLK